MLSRTRGQVVLHQQNMFPVFCRQTVGYESRQETVTDKLKAQFEYDNNQHSTSKYLQSSMELDN